MKVLVEVGDGRDDWPTSRVLDFHGPARRSQHQSVSLMLHQRCRLVTPWRPHPMAVVRRRRSGKGSGRRGLENMPSTRCKEPPRAEKEATSIQVGTKDKVTRPTTAGVIRGCREFSFHHSNTSRSSRNDVYFPPLLYDSLRCRPPSHLNVAIL